MKPSAWKMIFYSGEKHQQGEDHLRRLVLLNSLYFGVFAICSLFSAIYLAIGYYTMLPFCALSVILFTLLYLLNHKGLLRLSCYLSIILANVLIFCSYQLTNGSIGMDRFFIVAAIAPLMIFPLNQKRDIAITSVLSILLGTLTPSIPIVINFLPTIEPSNARLLGYVISPSSFILAMLPPGVLFYLSEKYFQEMICSRLNEVQSSRMAALGQMAAGIAHEINNPLAVIAGVSEQVQLLAGADRLDPKRLCKAADTITRNSHRITRIVKSLATFAREGGGDPFDWVPLAVILEDTVELCNQKLGNSKITLVKQVDINQELFCSGSQVMQILVNILNNAIDALDECAHDGKKIIIGTRWEVSTFILYVEDNGPGIPMELQQRITEPFFTTKKIGKGTGLGLSISKGIMERHQGHLSLDSRLGCTRFSLHFPQIAAEKAS